MESELTDQIKAQIDGMSHVAMARQWRFSPVGHPWFLTGPVYDYWKARFDSLGGMTSEISKQVGW